MKMDRNISQYESDKLNILQQIEDKCSVSDCFSEDELRILADFSKDKNSNIRSAVARILVDFTEKQGEEILLCLAKDKVSMVRVEACDSLRSSRTERAYYALKQIIKFDRNGMVRGYAVSSFAEISIKLNEMQDAVLYLKECLNTEQVVFTKIQLYVALYRLGDECYIKELLNLINTPRYQNRCAVVHSLSEIISEDNRNLIRTALFERKAVEKSRAVISTLENVLRTW